MGFPLSLLLLLNQIIFFLQILFKDKYNIGVLYIYNFQKNALLKRYIDNIKLSKLNCNF